MSLHIFLLLVVFYLLCITINLWYLQRRLCLSAKHRTIDYTEITSLLYHRKSQTGSHSAQTSSFSVNRPIQMQALHHAQYEKQPTPSLISHFPWCVVLSSIHCFILQCTYKSLNKSCRYSWSNPWQCWSVKSYCSVIFRKTLRSFFNSSTSCWDAEFRIFW